MINIAFHSLLIFLTAVSLLAGLISLHENEKRAALMFFILALIPSGVLLIPSGINESNVLEFQWSVIGSIGFVSLLLCLPIRRLKKIETSRSNKKYDERRTMFSRCEIKPGDEKFKQYYEAYPEDLTKDEAWRKNPGLLSNNSKYYELLHFAASDASFDIIGHFKNNRHFKASDIKENILPAELRTFISDWSKTLGAQSTGFTKIDENHYYSIKGRGFQYGKVVESEHQYAIAILVPMDISHVQTAPHAPTLRESSHQYVNSGIIALQIASFLSKLGYDATAHIDGAYDLIVPMVAQDAGLGTVGRMGLLISPKTGPRCRIAVVSTNFPLTEEKPKSPDKSVIDFCRICKKCALVCPSAAIQKTDRTMVDSSLRWQINQEKCFSYWTIAGTDCARCMAVCPYSHADNMLHKPVRFLIRNNVLFRHLAIKMDDLFYGKRPAPKKRKPIQ